MRTAETTLSTRESRVSVLMVLAVLFALFTSACIVDTPSIESTQTNTQLSTQEPVVDETPIADSVPQFEPTAVPAPPTAVVEPTATPVPPTPTPEPIPAPAVTPLPAEGADSEFLPSPVEAGPVAVPVRNAQFELDQTRPILQLPGHSLIYLDDGGQAEVDIFTPFATPDGTELADYDQVIDYLRTNAAFQELDELDPTTAAGSPATVFAGTTTYDPLAPVRAFITDADSANDDLLGWYVPQRLQMWVIDSDGGPVIVTAESLEDPGQFDQALALANSILDTITFS